MRSIYLKIYKLYSIYTKTKIQKCVFKNFKTCLQKKDNHEKRVDENLLVV